MKIIKFISYVSLIFGILISCAEINKQKGVKQGLNPQVELGFNEPKSNSGQWVALFNGENLDGWEVKAAIEDQQYNFWRVKEGTIVVNSMGITSHDYIWLQTKK